LTRVLGPETKNGYKFKANGCNTAEEIVSKYSEFCNKFLRCAIEILKGAKDGRDLEEIMKIVNMGKQQEDFNYCSNFDFNNYDQLQFLLLFI